MHSYHDKRWVVSLLQQVHFDIIKYLNAEINHKCIYSYVTQKQTFVLEWTGKIYEPRSVKSFCDLLSINVWRFLFYFETTARCCSSTWTADGWTEVSVTFLLRNLLVPRWDTDTSLICSRPKAADLWNCSFDTFSHLISHCCLSAPSSQLSGLNAVDLAVLLTCHRSSNSSSSRPVWKLLLSKASHVLDEALDFLTNKVWISNAPHVTHSWSDLDTVGVFFLADSRPQKSCSDDDFGRYTRNSIGYIRHSRPQ